MPWVGERELLGKVKGGGRHWRSVEQTGGGGGGWRRREAAWRCPEGAANGEESCDR